MQNRAAIFRKDEVIRWGHSIRQSPLGACILGCMLLAGFLTTFAGSAFHQFFTSSLKRDEFIVLDLALSCGGLLLSFGLIILAQIIRQRFSAVNEQKFSSLHDPREVLILFVSYQQYITSEMVIPDTGSLEIISLNSTNNSSTTLTLLRKNLLTDASAMEEKLDPPFSWEMLLRGIQPHFRAGCLKRIYLIGSTPKGTGPSKNCTRLLLAQCQAFLQPYVPNVLITPWRASELEINDLKRYITDTESVGKLSHECDFEAIEHVTHELNAIIDHDQFTYTTEERKICVDFTGGQKPSSVAAVLTCLNRRVNMQYVQTNDNKEAYSYRVSFNVGPDGLLHNPLSRG